MCNRARLDNEPETLFAHFGLDWAEDRPRDNSFNRGSSRRTDAPTLYARTIAAVGWM